MTYALKFQDLSLGYDRQPAVHRLQGEIAEGSLTAIVGPNGAGKSTVLKGVTGSLRPLEGRIAFGGHTRSEIAYLPQQSDVDRSFPIAVADLVAMGLWREIGGFAGLRAVHRARVAEAISAVGLEGFEKRPIGSLSGGQIQRALFARLLLQDAGLVLVNGGAKMYRWDGVKCTTGLAVACPHSPWEGPARGAARRATNTG